MEPYWDVDPGTEYVGRWVHYHGRSKILAPEWTRTCPHCGAKRPETDKPITDIRTGKVER